MLACTEFLRDLVVKQVLTLNHLSGNVMVADLLTKAVSRAVFTTLVTLLANYSRDGVVSPTSGVTESATRSEGLARGVRSSKS